MKDSIERYVQRELQLRDRRRGRLHPRSTRRARRSSSRARPRSRRPLPQVNDDHPVACKKDVDYTVDEKAHSAILTDDGRRARRDSCLNSTTSTTRATSSGCTTYAGAARAHALQARRRLPRRGRRGASSSTSSPAARCRAAAGPTACTRRSRPRRSVEDQGREPDAGDDHLPELLPHVQEAGRHDRHRRHRSGRVPQDLQARRRRRSRPTADGPQRQPRPRLQDRARQVPRGHRRRSTSCHEQGQPVLVGTISRREVRGAVARCSRKKGIPHNVLNAKHHEREANRRPGRPQGRGHDLDQHGRPRHRHHARRQPRVHGARRGRAATKRRRTRRVDGHAGVQERAAPSTSRSATPRREEVLAAGGLHILGTERHESRRIDNQLRGRAGRQGDPGSSRFYPVARRRPDAHLRRRAHHRR